ncbi:tetratricopeptide repeat protein [uncultured Microscilla sp.]|uniref:tetratricopeptide repeat protein n=1 Tax=uncultured Microscilla sp. TaxID=432653 RepID=UPI00260A9A6C|nr:tetratricopeptide repeat protein [uncultured Microscilla sp.]
MKIRIWLWVFLGCITGQAFAQKKATIDSLKQVLQNDLADTQRVKVYNQLALRYKPSQLSKIEHYSSLAIKLATQIKYPKGIVNAYKRLAYFAKNEANHTKAKNIFDQILTVSDQYQYIQGKISAFIGLGSVEVAHANYPTALRYYTKALKISKAQKLPGYTATVYNNIGVLSANQGNYAKALEYYGKSLEIRKKEKNKANVASLYNNMATIHLRQGDYALSLQKHLKALQIRIKSNDQSNISASYNNISLVYVRQGDYEKALEYQLKSLKLKEELGQKMLIATNYTNIGFVYSKQHQYDKALKYYFKALKIEQKKGNKRRLANCYDNIGEAYLAKKNYKKALSYLNKSLTMSLKLNEKSLASTVLVALGKTHLEQRKYKKAIQFLDRGVTLAKEIGKPATLQDGAETLAKVYKAKGDYKKAYEAHVVFKQMTDSLLNAASTKKITRLAANHEFQLEKDSLKIQQVALKAKFEKEKLTSSFRRNMSIVSLSALGVMLILAFFIYRSRQAQKKANGLLVQQKHELQEQKSALQKQKKELHQQGEELLTMNEELLQNQEEITAQRDDIEEKKSLLDTQHHQLTQSVRAALTIQQAILPATEHIARSFEEHFVVYHPKDVVSGDFYWLGTIDNKKVVGAIDCTGHGVPGAFMSMIGFTLLNDIVNTKKESDPAQILEMLRARVPKVLKQSKSGDKNGMDAAFVATEELENGQIELRFAGAKRPLWYVTPGSKTLGIIKGANVSIGFSSNNTRNIECHSMWCDKGTVFYIGSDGFADQNNEQRAKFGSHRLQQLIYKIHLHTMNAQKDILEQALSEHMKNTEQRDDILLLGLKV